MYSSRASDTSSGVHTAAPGVGKAVGDQEYRDTVLYLQQQQAMNHKEVMAAIRELSLKIDNQPRAPAGPQRQQQQEYMGSPPPHQQHDTLVSSPAGMSYGGSVDAALGLTAIDSSAMATGSRHAVQLASSVMAPSSAQVRDAELDSARARIAALEAQVRSLQQQVESKEMTVRRLSEAALREVSNRVGSISQSRPGASSNKSAPAMQPRAVVQHRDVADYIMALGDTSMSTRGGPGGVAAATGSTPTGGDAGNASSAREALELHERRCQQLLNAAPYSANSLTEVTETDAAMANARARRASAASVAHTTVTSAS